MQKSKKIKPLAAIRKSAGLSKNKASVMLDIGLTTLSRYENGENDVPFGVGEKMAVLYETPFENVRMAVKETKGAKGKVSLKSLIDNAINNPKKEAE